jgi:hypothetical protein
VTDIWTKADAADAMIGPDRIRRRHPTQWWRVHFAQDFDARTVRLMRACIAKHEIRREPRWLEAATGDAAAAVGLALKYRPVHAHEFDLVMTALTICAVRGSSAARVVMARVLRGLPDGAQAEVRIANSWLLLAYARRRDTDRAA